MSAEPAADGDPTEVRLRVKARDEEFKPLDNATVRLTVRPVKGTDKTDGTDVSVVQMMAEPSAANPGTCEGTYIARDSGAYSVEAVVTSADGKVAGRAVAGWTSDPAAVEFRSLKPNRALLESLAQRTGKIVRRRICRNLCGSFPNGARRSRKRGANRCGTSRRYFCWCWRAL